MEDVVPLPGCECWGFLMPWTPGYCDAVVAAEKTAQTAETPLAQGGRTDDQDRDCPTLRHGFWPLFKVLRPLRGRGSRALPGAMRKVEKHGRVILEDDSTTFAQQPRS